MNIKKVHLPLADRSYTIFIGSEILPLVGELCREVLPPQNCVIVGDSNTLPLFGEKCKTSLTQAGYNVSSWELPAGETSKNLTNLARLYDFLVESRLERKSFLIALGGGVVGDLTGFAAATYMRGIPFVQIPTTLLSQVDSSVGGKTAVNLPGGKNLVGAFHQPKRVLCDMKLLSSLSQKELSCGLSEVIKYGVILDAGFFAWLEEHLPELLSLDTELMAETVRRCCELKAAVTTEDERESGRRAILNFGHTLGHAIEQLYQYNTFSHGEAVALGQLVACRLSESLLGFPREETRRVANLLKSSKLPVTIHTDNVPATIDQLIQGTQRDKKTLAGDPKFVLAEQVGKVNFGCSVPQELLRETLREFVQKIEE
ncbi:MAG: 3-dehydroquinate synthase [Limisphaerales bacterium]|jgi:3-dehydroquinate synthase|nr:3-dehydroquinate synthase [Verrucomicrobiota bacterium]